MLVFATPALALKSQRLKSTNTRRLLRETGTINNHPTRQHDNCQPRAIVSRSARFDIVLTAEHHLCLRKRPNGPVEANFQDMNTHGLASHDKKKVCTMWFSWEMSRSTPEEPHLNSHFQHCPSSKSKVGMKRSLGAIFQDMNTHSLASHDKKKVCTMWFFWEMSRSTPRRTTFEFSFSALSQLKIQGGHEGKPWSCFSGDQHPWPCFT